MIRVVHREQGPSAPCAAADLSPPSPAPEGISDRTELEAPPRPPFSAEVTPSHPCVIIDRVTDEQTPEELEQLARSVAMSYVLGDRDRRDVVIALRRLAAIEKATARHPSNRQQRATAAD